jgi:hypothetical protein
MPRSHYSSPQEVHGWSSGTARHLMYRQVALEPPNHLRDYVASMLRLALTLLLGAAAAMIIHVLTT